MTINAADETILLSTFYLLFRHLNFLLILPTKIWGQYYKENLLLAWEFPI